MKPKKQQLPTQKAPARVIKPGVLPVHLSKSVWRAEIDCATAKQAKAIAAFFNLSEGEQADAIAKELAPDCGPWAGECAFAVLRRIKDNK